MQEKWISNAFSKLYSNEIKSCIFDSSNNLVSVTTAFQQPIFFSFLYFNHPFNDEFLKNVI